MKLLYRFMIQISNALRPVQLWGLGGLTWSSIVLGEASILRKHSAALLCSTAMALIGTFVLEPSSFGAV